MSLNLLSEENIKQFWFLNCPECAFKVKDKALFKLHVYENHSLSPIQLNAGTNGQSTS